MIANSSSSYLTHGPKSIGAVNRGAVRESAKLETCNFTFFRSPEEGKLKGN